MNPNLKIGTALDPTLLAELAGLKLDPWQEEVLLSQAPKIILNCARQSGKSTIAALAGFHNTISRSHALTLILSPSLRQSQELFRKVRQFYAILKEVQLPVTEESALKLECENGSRIICLPGKEETIRGYSSVSLLIIDEAARIEDNLYYSVLPMLAVSKGKLILLSTPAGKRGIFWQEWNSKETWKKILINAYQNPRIDQNYLENLRDRMSDWAFRQDFLCEFIESEDQFFSLTAIERAFDNSIEPMEFFN
jgi:hypothetical protein